MFSGIVETQAKWQIFEETQALTRIKVEGPSHFNDLKIGDSVCVNGVCLTVESFSGRDLNFALAAETLKVLNWTQKPWGPTLNLERSLKVGDRLHGHWVTGHVDELGRVVEIKKTHEGALIIVEFSSANQTLLWNKGSVALNGVSLTVNEVRGNTLSVYLIPETLRVTNLGALEKGSPISIEYDFMAKAVSRSLQAHREAGR